jgi:hypothetical protein
LKPAEQVCIECMMRDRDMADIDVTGTGAWARASDADYYEALHADEQDSASEQEHPPGLRKSGSWNAAGGTYGSHSGMNTSEESGYMADAGSQERRGPASMTRTRLGKGSPLTSPSLKLWTDMVRGFCSAGQR